jgi:hypothetical protein
MGRIKQNIQKNGSGMHSAEDLKAYRSGLKSVRFLRKLGWLMKSCRRPTIYASMYFLICIFSPLFSKQKMNKFQAKASKCKSK